MGYYSNLDIDRIERDNSEPPDDSGYFYEQAVKLEGEKAKLEADLAAAKQEVARLSAILREVRMHCTFEGDKAAAFARVWPLVLAFDDVA